VEERYVDVFSAFIFQQSGNDSTEHFFYYLYQTKFRF